LPILFRRPAPKRLQQAVLFLVTRRILLPAQIIERKRTGRVLTEEEIRFFVLGFTRGELPDYGIAAAWQWRSVFRERTPARRCG
jgi:hypothetical protein